MKTLMNVTSMKKKKSKRNKKMKILMQNQYFTDSCGVTSWLASNMSQN